MPRVKNDIGPYLQRRMRETFEGHPMVGEVRGRGPARARSNWSRDKTERSFFPDPGTVGTHCRNYCFNERPHHARHPRHDGAAPRRSSISETEVDELVAKAKSRHRPDGEGLRQDVTGVAATRAIGSL